MAIFGIISGILAANGFTIFGLSPALSAGLVRLGGGLILNAASAALNKQTLPSQEVRAVINQATAQRRGSYGQVRMGGVRAFFEAKGGVLHILVVHQEGPASSILAYVVDGQIVYLNDDDVATDVEGNKVFGGLAKIQTRNGTMSDYADLRSAFPDMWTDDHLMTNSLTSYTRLTANSSVGSIFPKGPNTPIQLDIEGREVLDPRAGLVAYSENAGPIIRDYMTASDGMRIAPGAIDDASVGAFADICDQPIALKAGGTQPRYRLAGTYGFNDKPKDVLSAMLQACDGQVYLTPEGKIGLMGGVYSEPDVTIGEDDILSIEWETGVSPLTDFNVLKGNYTSREHGYQLQEAPERRNETVLQTQPERTELIEVPWCPDGFQMQRLLKSYEAKKRPTFRVNLTTNLVGMKARYPKGDGIHTIRLSHSRIGGVYEVVSHEYSMTRGECSIGLQSIHDAWEWDALTEEKELAPPLADLAQNTQVPEIPENLLVTQEVVAISDTVSGVQIVARVDDPGQDRLQLVVEFLPKWFPEVEQVWSRLNVAVGARRATSGVVSEGLYSVRAYWFGEGVAANDFPQEDITVVSNPVVPGAPVSFAGSVSGSSVELTWTNVADNFDRTRIFRNSSDSFAGASFIGDVAGLAGQASAFTDAPGSGTFYYWAVTLNASSVPSAQTASVPATIT